MLPEVCSVGSVLQLPESSVGASFGRASARLQCAVGVRWLQRVLQSITATKGATDYACFPYTKSASVLSMHPPSLKSCTGCPTDRPHPSDAPDLSTTSSDTLVYSGPTQN